jgi:hypothetical protein
VVDTDPTKRNLPQITRYHLEFTFEDARCVDTLHKMLVRCGRAFAALCAGFQKK